MAWPKKKPMNVKLMLTDAEFAKCDEIRKSSGLSHDRLIIQALRLYSDVQAKLADGETCVWSGDARRAKDFAGTVET